MMTILRTIITVKGLNDEYGDSVTDGIKLIAAGLNIVNKWGMSESEIKSILDKYRDEGGDVVREPTAEEVKIEINKYRLRTINRWQDVK
jgi:hypothetical protein|tara:strand:+ start:1056 stop:1322 length:267 start_codon:yes stop_codon:yes gene_type:complete